MISHITEQIRHYDSSKQGKLERIMIRPLLFALLTVSHAVVAQGGSFVLGPNTNQFLRHPIATSSMRPAPPGSGDSSIQMAPFLRRSNNASTKSKSTTTSDTGISAPTFRGGGGSSLMMIKSGLGGSAPFFDNTPLLISSLVILASNSLGFLLSRIVDSHYHVDLLGTGAFATAALIPLIRVHYSGGALPTPPQRVYYSAAAVVSWSIKLALFLLSRVISNGGHDDRLNVIMADPRYCAGFWIYSLFWGIICSLPHSLGTTSPAPGNTSLITIGGIVFTTGWCIETLADFQKWSFKQSHHKEDFCNVGLWSISQHPNWFGNVVLWSGILLLNASALVAPTATKTNPIWGFIVRYHRLVLACLGPLFMWNLFDSQATGRLLPDSLQATRERYGYGINGDYTKYVDETPLIIPNPLQWFNQPSKGD